MTSVSVTKIRRGYSSPDRHKPLRVEERLIFRKKCFQSFEGVIRKVVSWFNVSNFSSKNISATKYFYPMVNVFLKNGLFLASFSLFLSFQYSFLQLIVNQICRWLDVNRGFMVLEATVLPTEQQPLPYMLKHYFGRNLDFSIT